MYGLTPGVGGVNDSDTPKLEDRGGKPCSTGGVRHRPARRVPMTFKSAVSMIFGLAVFALATARVSNAQVPSTIPCPPDVPGAGVRVAAPLHPCIDNDVKVRFATCGPCDSLLAAAFVPPDLIRLIARASAGTCPALCLQNFIVVNLGRLS